MKTVLVEILQNFRRAWRLAIYERKAKNTESFLGSLWEFLSPLLTILVYWFVFSVGLRSTTTSSHYPYVVWLVCGILPWMTISNTMSASTSSILSSASLIKSCSIPLSIFPLKTVLNGLLMHLANLVVLFMMVVVCGVMPTWHVFEIIYYTFAMLAFLISFALAASTINVFFNDLQKLLPAVLRLLMYASSVVIDINKFPEELQFFLRLNPIVHLIEGLRACILDGHGILFHQESFISFWVVTIILFVVGCALHVRSREHFIDVL